MIEVFVNKYDSFRVNDSSSPINIKHVSFASYDTAPMEFYYNCSTSEHKQLQHPVEENRSQNVSNDKLNQQHFVQLNVSEEFPDTIVKTVYTEHFSRLELSVLVISILSLSINIVHLYCMYLLFNYLES